MFFDKVQEEMVFLQSSFVMKAVVVMKILIDRNLPNLFALISTN